MKALDLKHDLQIILCILDAFIMHLNKKRMHYKFELYLAKMLPR